MLKSYQDFINEQKSYKPKPELSPSEQNILQDILYIFKKYAINYTSFSNVAHGSVDSGNIPITYVERLEDKYGFKKIKSFVKNNSDYIYSFLTDSRYADYDVEKITDENAFTDIFLNHFAPNKFILGGTTISDDPDYIIKYLYGWHENRYGLMAITQEFGDLNNYFDFIKKEISNDKEPYYNILGSIDDIVDKGGNIFICKGDHVKQGSEYFRNYNKDAIKSGRVIVIDSKSTAYYMVILTFGDKEKYSNEKHIAKEMTENGLKEYFTVFNFDISDIDDEEVKKYSKISKSMGKYNI